jgi:hypothetical protein
MQSQPTSARVALEFAYNGIGTDPTWVDLSGYAPDTLTRAAQSVQQQFKWISHTYTHLDLTLATQDDVTSELLANDGVAANTLRLSTYSRRALVTPGISGFNNPAALQAMADFGVRSIVGDTSRGGVYTNPTPNTGTYLGTSPSLLVVPRRPTSLFYNVSTPQQWVAEYNCLYSGFWGRNKTYPEILDYESDTLLSYLLKWDVDPLMFHAPNIARYDGVHTLLSDLIDLTLQKYGRLFSVPIVSPNMDGTAGLIARRMQYNASGVTASIVPGSSITLTAVNVVTVPVTGLSLVGCGACEVYAGQPIAYVDLAAGQSVTLPLR